MYTNKYINIITIIIILALVSVPAWSAYGRFGGSSYGMRSSTGGHSSMLSHRSQSSSPLLFHRTFGSESILNRPLLGGLHNKPFQTQQYYPSHYKSYKAGYYKPYTNSRYNSFHRPRYGSIYKSYPGYSYGIKHYPYYKYHGKKHTYPKHHTGLHYKYHKKPHHGRHYYYYSLPYRRYYYPTVIYEYHYYNPDGSYYSPAVQYISDESYRSQQQYEEQPAASIDNQLEKIAEAFASEDYFNAVYYSRRAVEQYPEDVPLKFVYAQSLMADNDYHRAAQALRQAIDAADIENEGVFFPFGIYPDNETLNIHIDKLKQKVRYEPSNTNYQLLLGYELLGIGNYDDATTALEKAKINLENEKYANILLDVIEKLKQTAKENENTESFDLQN
jgi:hypothetical protein